MKETCSAASRLPPAGEGGACSQGKASLCPGVRPAAMSDPVSRPSRALALGWRALLMNALWPAGASSLSVQAVAEGGVLSCEQKVGSSGRGWPAVSAGVFSLLIKALPRCPYPPMAPCGRFH